MSDLDFGFRVRTRRRLLDISQDDLGKAVGISQVAIKKIESGGKTRYGRKIAETLETTLRWLETGHDQAVDDAGNKVATANVSGHGPAPSISVASDDDVRTSRWPLKKSTVDRIHALTPTQRKKLDDMIDAVLKGFEAEGK